MNAVNPAPNSLRTRLRAALGDVGRVRASRERVLAAQFYASSEPGVGRVLPLPKSHPDQESPIHVHPARLP